MGRELPISPKRSREVAKFIRGKRLSVAKKELELVSKKEMAIPYFRHNRKIPHRKGMMSGKYPVKVADAFLRILQNAESNAADMNTDKLVVGHVSVNKARPQIGRRKGATYDTKTTHLQIVLTEEE